MYKNQIHNETNTDMYYIKIIEELCWAKHLPLNTLCAYLDYMTFWLTTEKDIKKRLYVTILRSSTTKIWVRLVHEQNIQITQDKCWPDKETIFFFSIKKTQKTDNFVTHFRSQNKKKLTKNIFTHTVWAKIEWVLACWFLSMESFE